MSERIRRLVNDNARMQMDQEVYQKEYDELSVQYGEVMNQIVEIDEEVRSREMRRKQIELFLRMFEKQEADVEFDAGAFVAMVERVVVRTRKENKQIVLQFELRSGQVQIIDL